MSSKELSSNQALESIIQRTTGTIESSRTELFKIGEESRHEYRTLERELKEIRKNVAVIIEKTDRTEVFARIARKRLAEMSANFRKYSNTEVRSAYEQANQLQVQLAVLQQEEAQLRDRRDQVERRLLGLEATVERADNLIRQLSLVFTFLTGEMRQVNDAIKEAKEKQEFGLKILEVQEEERKRLSREIHDGPAQMLASVLMRSELVERTYQERGIEEALKEIHDLRQLVKSSLAEVRRIIYDLRPMALDDLGLIPALKKYLVTTEKHTGIKISFRYHGQEKRLPQQVESALFRLIQEAVNNAYKHGQPNEVHVKLEIENKQVTIIVKDDGKGFDRSERKEGTFGLIGMKERINVLKGELSIDSALNQGTVVTIQIPLNF